APVRARRGRLCRPVGRGRRRTAPAPHRRRGRRRPRRRVQSRPRRARLRARRSRRRAPPAAPLRPPPPATSAPPPGTRRATAAPCRGVSCRGAGANGAVPLSHTTVKAALRPWRLHRHRLGTAPAEDVIVHQEGDEHLYLGVHRTKTDRFVLLTLGSKITSEI